MLLVCPTAFKGTISAGRAARAMSRGAAAVAGGMDIVTLPLADGGNGLIDALRTAAGGTVREVRVSGPLGDPVRGRLLIRDDGVVVETADACGLHLVPPERRDPLRASTRGVGELLRAAAAESPARIIAGLGGSATVDGGAGMAAALGWRLLDAAGAELPTGGGSLERLVRVEPPASLELPPVLGLADVDNPLLGPTGAALVFGPQKGADAAAVARLERGLTRLAEVLLGSRGLDVRSAPGTGAAGGLGAGLMGFLGASLESGSAWVLDAVGFDARLAEADAVVTGEGAYDGQTAMGKVVGVAVERARRRGVPVLVVAGEIGASVPRGVLGVDGGGSMLGPAELERMVRENLPRLLPG